MEIEEEFVSKSYLCTLQITSVTPSSSQVGVYFGAQVPCPRGGLAQWVDCCVASSQDRRKQVGCVQSATLEARTSLFDLPMKMIGSGGRCVQVHEKSYEGSGPK